MLTLLTSNPAKYEPFREELARWRISLEKPRHSPPEIQSFDFAEALLCKARAAAELAGRPVLVDDAGLVLEAYPGFPGPLTGAVLRSLGVAGFRRLLDGVSERAAMECHIGCWVAGALRSWSGSVSGRLDASKTPLDPRMPLSDLFVPDSPHESGRLLHRARALTALADGLFDLHLETEPEMTAEEPCGGSGVNQCAFCTELEDASSSIFAEMLGERLASRVVYEDEHFLLFPPLGQFMEGGLLLLSRQHIRSFACLPPSLFGHLERLVAAVGRTLRKRYGESPLVFEHGPAPERSKGVCCVDHAHLNIFPAPVRIHPKLSARMNRPIGSLADIARLRRAEFGYLLVQENDGTRRAYDGQYIPTQLVRRIITAELGRPERWHWRDYAGCDELVATYQALKGQINL